MKTAVYEAGIEVAKTIGFWLLDNLLLALVYTWFIWLPLVVWFLFVRPVLRAVVANCWTPYIHVAWVPPCQIERHLAAGWLTPAEMLAELAAQPCLAGYARYINRTLYLQACNAGPPGCVPAFCLCWQLLWFAPDRPPVVPAKAPQAAPPGPVADLSRVKVFAIDASSDALPPDAMTLEVAEATLVASDKTALAAKVLATAAELRQRHPNRTVYVVPAPKPESEGVVS